ncbi:mannose-1-phosphate guanylyltransferase/mannose-6-phosphate isomerase [Salinicola aestuarinus]|uniref:mannose-1-phosphate guanylyltransferase/mannose-6-phosphate isomerase n=1 Tax=Salinicola aestuarinus TaxID=1949082 RepID=UPI000DA119AB|nr:mannose-1-phosphate guanylyltransferase/mannose-6-phosphate isomerase [Salinicola aestuarinus]
MLIPVILAGGAGTRLWPVSRASYPKQFLPVVGEQSMLVETLSRLKPAATGDPIVICQESHRFLVAEQLRAVNQRAEIVLEPMMRNTAPAIAVAALAALERDEEAMLLVLPADHAIAQPEALLAALEPARIAAQTGKLVTFGIHPTRAETGYGYIEAEEPAADAAVPVIRFIEKPAPAVAADYFAGGRHLWNSGMFMMRADRYLETLSIERPAMLAAVSAAWRGRASDLDFLRLDAEAFARCESESIDYAVMESTPDASVVALDAGWSDVGSWESLWEIADKDPDGNALDGDVMIEDVGDSLIYAESRLVAAVGVRNLLIVETADAVMVAPRASAQAVKTLAESLKRVGRPEWNQHRRVHRPWGSYDGIHAADRYQVKQICVAPGARLSLQRHFHRAEHWIVVRGTARVTRGDDTFLLEENQSTYIPLGVIHRLENPGKIQLELIEVQSGSYLGEDDIERYDDVYHRD